MPRKRDPEVPLEALGNAVRRTIVRRLAEGPRAVGEIASGLPVSRPAVSRHLKILERARLISHTKEGTQNLYRLEREGFDEARVWLDSFWDEAIPRFVMVAENTRRKK